MHGGVGTFEPDCAQCVGLCCVALPFRPSHGFAFAKDAGEPCRHLDDTYRCSIHASLGEAGMGGCIAYECFGAGQHVTKVVYAGATWRGSEDGGAEMFAVFAVVQRLHEMLVLLDQASALVPGPDLTRLRERVAGHTSGAPEDILGTDLDRLSVSVGDALRGVSRAVRGDGPSYAGHDLAGRDLRDTDLARADLRGAVLIAADLRDASSTAPTCWVPTSATATCPAPTSRPRCSSPSPSSTRPGEPRQRCCRRISAALWAGRCRVRDSP